MRRAVGIIILGVVSVGLLVAVVWLLRPRPQLAVVRPEAPLVRSKQPVPSVRLTDVTQAAGIEFQHFNGLSGKKLLPETMGGGVVVLDYNQDGRPDLFFPNSCPWPGREPAGSLPTSKLYRNEGQGRYTDVTREVGLAFTAYGMGGCAGDFDNDGYEDLFVSCVGRDRLFRNVSGQRFEELPWPGTSDLPKIPWDDFLKVETPIPFGASATFVDYDRDGRLDLFVCRYVTWSPQIDLNVSATLQGGERAFVPPREFDGSSCELYRNVDGRQFEPVTDRAGIRVTSPDGTGPNARQRGLAKSLGVIVCDPDRDGWPDLAVANDTVRNFFFHNIPGPDGTRIFEEIGEKAAVAYADEGRPRGGMGIDEAEYLPGKSALLIANFANEPNTFLRLSLPQPLLYTDAALAVGLAGPSRSPLKFGACFFDLDNDGRPDLITANGHIEPDIATIQKGQSFAQPAQLYWNTGDPARLFELATEAECGPDLFQPLVGRGCAYLDYDGDGDLDLVLVGNGGPAKLFRNELDRQHGWVRLLLQGDGVTANRSAIGAEVEIDLGDRILKRTIAGARGYLSQPELAVHVGLGGAESIRKVSVRWPTRPGQPVQVWRDLPVRQTIRLIQGDPNPRYSKS